MENTMRNPIWPGDDKKPVAGSGTPRRDDQWKLRPPLAASPEEAHETARVVGYPNGSSGRET